MSFVFFCVLRSGFKNITTSCESLVTPEHASFLADRSLLAIASVLVSFCGLLAPQTCGIGGSRKVTCLASAPTGKSGQSETAHSVEERGEQGRAIVTWTTSCTLSPQQPSHKATIQRDVPLRLGWSTTSLGRMAPSTSERRIQTKEEGGQRHPPHSSLLGDYRRRQPS